jgi:hypothetical protein
VARLHDVGTMLNITQVPLSDDKLMLVLPITQFLVGRNSVISSVCMQHTNLISFQFTVLSFLGHFLNNTIILLPYLTVFIK